jgi:undecaprenyl-diphosphatase
MNDYWLALILGVVEGLTEFLPISSTAHLLLAEEVLGVDRRDGFWKMFTVVIQLGAILAVVVYYAPRLRDLIADFFSPRGAGKVSATAPVPRWRHPLVLVLVAVVPAGAIGALAKKRIDEVMESTLPIAVALAVGGVLIELIERLTRGRGTVDDVAQVSPVQAIAIGFAQAVALIPGSSRSATTIMGGRLCGVKLRAAADFSFLLSIPTMTAASGYSLYSWLREHNEPIQSRQWAVLGIGFVTAFVVALLVVAWFLHYLRSHSFRLFAVYRVLLGLGVIAAWGAGRLK